MIKKIIKSVSFFVVILSLTACGGGGTGGDDASTDSQSNQPNSIQPDYSKESIDLSEFNENIIITTVDSEGTPVSDAWVEWAEATATAADGMIDAVCIDEACTTWVLDQFPTGTIRVTAIKYVEWENDSLCHDVFEGEIYVDANIDEVQELQIIVEQTPSICQ